MKKTIIVTLAIITFVLTVAPAAAITKAQHQRVRDYVKISKQYLPMKAQPGVRVDKIKKEGNIITWFYSVTLTAIDPVNFENKEKMAMVQDQMQFLHKVTARQNKAMAYMMDAGFKLRISMSHTGTGKHLFTFNVN
jgi:hypothetical protein